jgi:hypothetical protein
MPAGNDVKIHAFITSVFDGGELLALRSGRFSSGDTPSIPIGQESGLAPQPVGTVVAIIPMVSDSN